MAVSDARRAAIVGGGMLGLTLAHRLSRAGMDVTLFEAAPSLGGLTSAWQLGDVTWDRYYHVTLLSDSCTRGIVGELGLGDAYRWVETKTGFYADGRLSSMSNALEYLQLPALGLMDKLRLGATIVYGSRLRAWQRLEGIPVERWLTQLSGRRTFERVWRPLLQAKLGDSYRESSAAFIWATIARLYAARRSGLKKEMFGYVRGGYARVMDAFEEQLAERGVALRLGTPVQQVEPRDGVLLVRTEGSEQPFDRVVLTSPAPVASQLCPALSASEHRQLQDVRYQGIVCASVLLRRSLSPYYLTYLTDDWVPFTAVVEMTAMVDPGELGGHALVYLPKYISADDPFFSASDEEVQERYLAALARIYPHFSREDVLAFRVARARHIFPIPRLHYSRHVPPTVTSVRGLYLANSAQIVNGTLNVNETVGLAERLAAEIAQHDPQLPGRAA